MKYFKLSICLIALIIGLAWKHYLIPIASLALAIVLENDFHISSFSFLKTKRLGWYSKLLQSRYGTDSVYISVSLQNGKETWYAVVNYYSAYGSSFDDLLKNLDKNLVIYKSCKKSLKRDVVF